MLKQRVATHLICNNNISFVSKWVQLFRNSQSLVWKLLDGITTCSIVNCEKIVFLEFSNLYAEIIDPSYNELILNILKSN